MTHISKRDHWRRLMCGLAVSEKFLWLFLIFVTTSLNKTPFYGGVLRRNRGASQPDERSCSIVWWYGIKHCLSYNGDLPSCFISCLIGVQLCRRIQI